MSAIQTYNALIQVCEGEAEHACEAVQESLYGAAGDLRTAILKSRAQSRADLDVKIAIWSSLVRDPACIQSRHEQLWEILVADILAFTRLPYLEGRP